MRERPRQIEQQTGLYAGDTFQTIENLPETAFRGAKNIFKKLVKAVSERI